MFPAWKSGCQIRGATSFGSFGTMCGTAGKNFFNKAVWASGESCSGLEYCHGVLFSPSGFTKLLIQSISRVARDWRYSTEELPRSLVSSQLGNDWTLENLQGPWYGSPLRSLSHASLRVIGPIQYRDLIRSASSRGPSVTMAGSHPAIPLFLKYNDPTVPYLRKL
jgi:hypothetical protein